MAGRLAAILMTMSASLCLPMNAAWGQGAARPQLPTAQAERYTAAAYLGDWQPAPLEAPSAITPDFIVAADGSGTHRTVQAAIDALPAVGAATRRHYILIRPGTYREAVCAEGRAPFRLYGAGDPSAVVLVEGRYNGLVKPRPRPAADVATAGASTSGSGPSSTGPGCQALIAAGGASTLPPSATASAPSTYGTPGSASVMLLSDDVQLQRLTIANDAMDTVRAGQNYPTGAGESGGAQAVALLTRGDRVQIEDVRLIGHQDTFEAERPDGRAGRVLVRRSEIRGDVDFIFGAATLVIDDSLIVTRAGRRQPGHGGHVIAPSTPEAEPYGFLIQRSRWLAEAGVAPGSISLGRAWDRGVAAGTWQPSPRTPNGQAVLRDNLLGPHLAPWSASTSRRPFNAEGPMANRMAEYRNLALPAAAYEALPEGDGWASMDGGTWGGARAAPEAVRWIHTRAELDAALALGDAPKLLVLSTRIDLAADANGRTATIDDFRDPAFDFAAFARAYDPATWGRRAPEGPLEDARRRSAQRQAARIVVRLPSNTTLVGVGDDPGFDNGMLFIERARQVIVRHLRLSDAYDFFPAWDPLDNGHGEWNSEYDTLSLRDAEHVWVDHCSFDDGGRPDRDEPTWLGRPLQRHDGLLDITRRSDLVTVSWSVFRHHDKTMLIGGGDNHRDDRGRLRVTLHHNLWEGVKERTPRVRYGQVQVANNLFVVTATQPEGYAYSLGVGFEAQLLSDANAWELPPGLPPTQVVRRLKGERFEDRGSLINGAPADLTAALRQAALDARPPIPEFHPPGWTPPYAWRPDPVTEVAPRVRQGAGAGRLW